MDRILISLSSLSTPEFWNLPLMQLSPTPSAIKKSLAFAEAAHPKSPHPFPATKTPALGRWQEGRIALVTDICVLLVWIRCDWIDRYVVVMLYDDDSTLDSYLHFNHMCHIMYPPKSMMVLEKSLLNKAPKTKANYPAVVCLWIPDPSSKAPKRITWKSRKSFVSLWGVAVICCDHSEHPGSESKETTTAQEEMEKA